MPKSIDYSKVRAAGTPIKGFGGVSSGPEPLKELIQSCHDILTPAIGKDITSTHIADLCNLVGRCVVSGNVRRSAEIAFGDPEDGDFLNLKNPEVNQEALMHHRWSSNNSVFASVGMDYSKVAELTAKNGEPGYQWMENARAFSRMNGIPDYLDSRAAGTNPCVEQTLEDEELCNLVETFPGRHDSFEDYLKTLKYAYLYAKTVTLIPTHNARTNTVMMRNRRIGCSMSGIVQAMQKFGRRNFLNTFCDKGYTYLRELDKVYSDWLCVRTSVKITSVKPSGTVSLLPGVTPGIHFPHAKHYIRRVRLQENSPLVKTLFIAGYPIEPDKYSPNTVVATFPVEERNFDRSKDEVSLWEQLELAAQIQQYWADNQVSVTVTFKSEEAKDIKHSLEMYETRLKGVSFLPLKDHGYEQAPYETCTEEQYSNLVKDITPLSDELLVHDSDSKYCDGESCVI
jgi:adenosylcobalamin-dependent ribonucleoside-triphosphate reductase